MLCGGCAVGPDYHPPSQTMPAHWQSPPTTQASVLLQQPLQVEQWWTTFHDPMLDSLVHRAVASNLDLQLATERILAARAQVGINRAALFPNLDGNGNYTRSGGAKTGWSSLWTAGLDSIWEIDIFGGIRRSVEQASASYEASIEDRRDVLVTLLGEVATDYIQLRGYQQEVLIARQNLEVQTRNAKIARDKKALGTGTNLDIAQADSQVASTTATMISLQTSAQQSMYAISVLLGQAPTDLDEELTPQKEVPAPPSELPVGLPSDLLRRRPDIRRSERQLAAATAGIGVAVAQLFPQFSLTGNLNLQASRIDNLDWNHSLWSFGPSVNWSIFSAGAVQANIDLQDAGQKQALTTYHQTVLTALLEVQNVLVAYAQEQHRRVALAEAVAMDKQAVELATERYQQGGLTDFLAVLDAERALFASQDALVQSNAAVGTDAVALYKALGGGWQIGEPAPTTAPTNAPASR
jgi:NodT family efflux transporter outer membrane factor (OMF) lipoprotein